MLQEISSDSAIAERLKFQTLTWLCSAINSNAGVFYEVGGDLSQSRFLTYNVDLAFHRRYISDLHQLDPLHPRRCQALGEPVVRLSDTLPASGRTHSEYFRHFVAPQGIEEIVEVFFRRDGRLVAGISVLKYGRGTPLAARDLGLLAQVHPLMESYLLAVLSSPSLDERAAAFTEREQMVLALVQSGLSNKVIARRLAISVPTVKTHIRSILAKTGTTSRATLLAKMFWH